jgi:hypothetical protein
MPASQLAVGYYEPTCDALQRRNPVLVEEVGRPPGTFQERGSLAVPRDSEPAPR